VEFITCTVGDTTHSGCNKVAFKLRNRGRGPEARDDDQKAAGICRVTWEPMLASLTATFIQRHRVGAILAATVLQIAGFLVLFVAGVIDSDGLRIAAFAIAVIGALLAAAVMIFLAVARSARSAALGAALFISGAAFEVSFALRSGTPHWIGFIIIAVAVPVVLLNRNL